ncbi:hypothetical protein E2488_08700 [Gramella jeungdoensis]|uniref:DUF3311 domain-containing protein n=1 Tax=Gramella jeungdoensis TaxID=708091 RepID=A0A4Y8AUM0_9FLAO|nr:hypothetical protein [Gramella jeungdoensis]TEW75575.1 hypothetical protein E2488_08700 [Gramella jeungdoensis]
MKKRHQQKLIVLTILLLSLFNIPIILLFDAEISVFGFPLIYFYIFVVWILAIIISHIILKRFYE